MRNWNKGSMVGAVVATAIVSTVIAVTVTRTAGQSPETRPARTVDDLSLIHI